MNWDVWTEIERSLLEFKIQPILAVVPDNRDPHLQVGPARPHFWQEVRRWQSQGWTIGLHGYQHHFVTRSAGIVGLNERSEFAGLSADQQGAKLQLALGIFEREGVTADVWVAPAHSFDAVTVKTLKNHGLRIISDGFFTVPRVDADGVFWIPQQLWRFRRMPFGVWTVCVHHNAWTSANVRQFRTELRHYRALISNVAEVTEVYAGERGRWIDPLVSQIWQHAILVRRKHQEATSWMRAVRALYQE
jgi:predicted deacetylase